MNSAAPGDYTSNSSAEQAQLLRTLRAQLATVTGGLAPDVYANAWWDWYLNLSKDPSRQLQIMQDAWTRTWDSWTFALKAAGGQPLAPVPGDPRFAAEAWSQWPFNVYAHSYNQFTNWWQQAMTQVAGVSSANERTLDFLARTSLEALSPANFLSTNPELLETTRLECGQNLVRGFQNWLEDAQRAVEHQGPPGTERYQVGRDIAATPGRVVLRNELIELIQYAPSTPSVYAEPVLLVPAWIMKYYILDLSPANSLVRYLVSQGHTVFIISWKNPDAGDRNMGMDDYLRLGVRASIDAISTIVPDRGIQAVGYCIGGTLLSIGAAVLDAEGDRRLKTVSLLAAQQDFSEPGELSVFISPSQIDMLEAVMDKAGVLKSEQMGGAFALLRARDLLWTPAINSYLRGKRDSVNDLMAWNADGTRMPCRMHSEYLRGLYLDNALARGEFRSNGRTVDLKEINQPMFVVGTETDHVAPWRSVYKARRLTNSSDFTFLLTSGGHNAGIISGPSHPKRRHRVYTWHNATDAQPAEEWFQTHAAQPGSWWPVWQQWLVQHCSDRVAPPPLGAAAAGYAPLTDAPGEYVLQK